MSMSAQSTYIFPQHQVALSTAQRAHAANGLTPGLLNRLYLAAKRGLDEPVEVEGLVTSTLTGDIGKLSTATDEKLGVYVQMALLTGQKQPTLTVGQKWVQETSNSTLHSTATKFW